MSLPIIADKRPVILELDPGTYHYCTCGQSKNQPFCDGSHAGTEFVPMEFTVEEKKRAAYCQCKRTEKGPYCDGAHTKL